MKKKMVEIVVTFASVCAFLALSACTGAGVGDGDIGAGLAGGTSNPVGH